MRRRLHLTEWFFANQWPVLITLAVLGMLTYGFIQIADEVMEGETQRFDDMAIRALRTPGNPADPIGPRWLEECGRDMTALGGFSVMTLVVGGVAGYLFLSKKFGTMALVIAATLGALLLSAALKHSFNRPRPELVPQLSIVYTSSFPSGHSMNSAAVYLTLAAILARVAQTRALKVFFVGMAVIVTVLVGISRVYMGVHYPSDVLAGWTGGTAWAVLCLLVTSYLQHRGTVERTLQPDQAGTPCDD